MTKLVIRRLQGYGNAAPFTYPDIWARKPDCLHLPYSTAFRKIGFGVGGAPFVLKITWSILLRYEFITYISVMLTTNVHSLYLILFYELAKPNGIVSKILNLLGFQVFKNISVLKHTHLFDSKYNFRVYFWEIPVFHTLKVQTILLELHCKTLFITLKSVLRRKILLNYIKCSV